MKIKGRNKKTRRQTSPWWGITFIFLMLGMIISLSYLLSIDKGEGKAVMTTDNGETQDLQGQETPENTEETKQEAVLPEKLDLQNLAETWVKSASGRVGLYIYDLDYREPIAKVNETSTFQTASLYKLFPVYEGYRRVEKGDWAVSSILTGSRTIGDCLDAAIRSSDSVCGEALWNKIGRTNLDAIISTDYKITNSKISGLSSNPVDIAKILELFYDHPEFSEETYAKIKDSMLNQPPTDNGMCSPSCDWRQGLPAGLSSDRIKVYDKVGWDYRGPGWNLYHDATLVTASGEGEAGASPERHLIVVIMTANLNSYQEIISFGKQLKSVL